MKNMNSLLSLILMSGIIFTYSGCEKIDPGFGGNASLTLKVTYNDPATGIIKVAENAIVNLSMKLEGKEADFNYNTKTDTGGNCVIQKLEHSANNNVVEWIISVSALINGNLYTSNKIIETTKEKTIYFEEINLSINTSVGTSSIQGLVFYKDVISGLNIPAKNTTFTLTPLGSIVGETPPQSTSSNDNGSIEFHGLIKGSYALYGVNELGGHGFFLDTTFIIPGGSSSTFSATMNRNKFILNGVWKYSDVLSSVIGSVPQSSSLNLYNITAPITPVLTAVIKESGQFSFNNLPIGTYLLQGSFLSGDLTYRISDTINISADKIDYSLTSYYNEPGSIILKVIDDLGTPQKNAIVCYFSNVIFWSLSTLCTGSVEDKTVTLNSGKLLFKDLAPGSNYFFFGHKIIGTDTLKTTKTISVSATNLTLDTLILLN